MINSILEVNQLGVSLNQQPLLRDISFRLNAQQVLAVIGPNGAGKTTLLRSLSGDLNNQSGNIKLHGRRYPEWNKRELACCLASLPQHSSLNFPFTVHEVVSLARLPHQSGRDVDREIVHTLLDKLDISELAERRYTQLSGGEKQRVQLARVVAQLYPLTNVAKVLLLDEPANGLDLKHQKLLADFLKEISQQGVAIILTSHDLNWALSFSDSVLALKHGETQFLGGMQAVINNDKLAQLFEVPIILNQNPTTEKLTVSLQ